MRMKPIHKIWMFQLLALVLAVLVAAWNPVQVEQPAGSARNGVSIGTNATASA